MIEEYPADLSAIKEKLKSIYKEKNNKYPDPEIIMPPVPQTGNFEKLAEAFFPKDDISSKESVLMLLAILPSIVSVIPNFVYGGGFAKQLAEQLAEKMKQDLNPEELNIIVKFGALMSAVVNGVINSRSVYRTMEEFIKQAKAFGISKHRAKLFFTLLGMLGFSGIAAVPNLQFAEDSIGGWTDPVKSITQWTIFAINVALSFRGISGLTNVISQKVFGQENREKAKLIRKKILTELNQKLEENNLADQQINRLAEGKLYTNKYPALYIAVQSLGGALPGGYSSWLYISSTMYAMEKILNMRDKTAGTPEYDIFQALIYLVSVISWLVKWAFLSRVNFDIVDRFFNYFLSDPIILESKDKMNGLQAFGEILALIAGAMSLSGGMGMVAKYLFKGAPFLNESLMSVLVTLLGAWGINYIDIRDIGAKLIDKIVSGVTNSDKTIEDINQSKFGKTFEDFIHHMMLNIAKMPDSEILQRFENPGETQSLLQNTNDKLSDILTQIAGLTKNNYGSFLISYGKQPEETNIERHFSINNNTPYILSSNV